MGLFIVNPKELETGLRTSHAGIPYTLLMDCGYWVTNFWASTLSRQNRVWCFRVWGCSAETGEDGREHTQTMCATLHEGTATTVKGSCKRCGEQSAGSFLLRLQFRSHLRTQTSPRTCAGDLRNVLIMPWQCFGLLFRAHGVLHAGRKKPLGTLYSKNQCEEATSVQNAKLLHYP